MADITMPFLHILHQSNTFNKFQFTFHLAAQKLKPQAHASRSGPLRVNSDEARQQGLHRPQLRTVVVAIPFKHLPSKGGRKGGRKRDKDREGKSE